MPASIPCRFQTTLLIPLAAALAFGWACPAVATTIIVDNFTAGTADLNITAAAPPTQIASDRETGLAGVVGGSRELTIRKILGTSGSTRNVTGAVDAANEELLYISGSGVTGSMTLAYDANEAGLNLSTNPLKSIQIEFSPTAVSADFTLGAITIVPEPSMHGLALAGLCLTGYSILCRKSCRRSARVSRCGWEGPSVGLPAASPAST